ncbi:MAG TPA: sigma-E factor negative regulatory protein [Burkholderiaceae bacterium]|nr:sigma-E factor negative regulatory protein [Burkholderiaceae bacterium]
MNPTNAGDFVMNNQSLLAQVDEPHAWEKTISTWVDGDGEIRPDELDSPYGRQVWDTYHLIGDVLRSPDLAILPSDFFYARVSKQIDAEPPIVAPKPKLPVRRLALGILALVFVGALSWLSLPLFDATAPHDSSLQLAATLEPESTVSDYIEAHREIAGVNMLRHVAYSGGVLDQ